MQHKPNSLRWWVLFFVCVCFSPTHAEARATPQPLLKPLTQRMLASFPPDRAVLIGLHLGHWKHARKTLRALLNQPKGTKSASLSPMAKVAQATLTGFLKTKEPKALLQRLLLMGQLVASPKQAKALLQHLDTRYPILHTPFYMADTKARKALQLGLFGLRPIKRGETPLSTPFRLTTFPSTNPKALIAALSATTYMKKISKPWAEGERLLGIPGARVHRQGKGLLFLLPHKGFVLAAGAKPLPTLAFTKKQGLVQTQIKDLKSLLKRGRKPQRMTRALAHFLKDTGMITLYGHRAHILKMGALRGLFEAYSALEHATKNMQQRLLAKYYSIAMAGMYMMTTPASEFEDSALSFSLRKGFLLQAVSSLTQAGQKAYKAGLQGGATTIAMTGPKPQAGFSLNGDLGRIIGAFVKPLPWITAMRIASLYGRPSLGSASIVYRNCGISCKLAMWVGGVWHLIKGAMSLVKPGKRRMFQSLLPVRARIALLSIKTTPKGTKQKIALAILFKQLKPQVRKMLRAYAATIAERGAKLTMLPAPSGGTCVVLSNHVEGVKVFGKCKLTKPTQQGPRSLHHLHVELKSMRGALGVLLRAVARRQARAAAMMPLARNILPHLEQLRGRSYITKHARIIQLQLATSITPKQPPTLSTPAGISAPLPLPKAWPSQGPRMCLAKLQQLHVEVAKTLDGATADMKKKLVMKFHKRAQPNIACLAKDASLKQLVPAIQAIWKRALKLAQ